MRQATRTRNTAETEVTVTIDLDGTGRYDNRTGVGFFDHMLDQLARHALVDLTVEAEGDRHIDDHHTVEDVGIVLGQALDEALGDKRGIRRYGSCLLPMDDTLARAALDLSGRPFLVWKVDFTAPRVNRTAGGVADRASLWTARAASSVAESERYLLSMLKQLGLDYAPPPSAAALLPSLHRN